VTSCATTGRSAPVLGPGHRHRAPRGLALGLRDESSLSAATAVVCRVCGSDERPARRRPAGAVTAAPVLGDPSRRFCRDRSGGLASGIDGIEYQGGDGVRKATLADVRDASQMLARAFDDDPLTTWMFPDATTRRRRLPAWFASLIRPALDVDEVYVTERLQGLAFWYPPGTFPFGWKANATVGLSMVRLLRGRLLSQLRGLLYLGSHHPKEPHWYLGMLGTDPQWQGKGSGLRFSPVALNAALKAVQGSTSRLRRRKTSLSMPATASLSPRRCTYRAVR